MCTVTFLPLGDQRFVLTSNRDVSYKRAEADRPIQYLEEGVNLIYPKDGKAGGTWIGSSRNNRLMCLLNGGFENHKRRNSYRKSRGLIVKELLIAENLNQALNRIDLNDIEPFTLVIVQWERLLQLSQFIWDGKEKHRKELELKPRIWSSSTLFNAQMRETRQKWFDGWMAHHSLSPDSILEFHKHAGEGNNQVGVILKREQVGTVSLTQFVNLPEEVMAYESISRSLGKV